MDKRNSPSPLESGECKLIHKETAKSIIVERADGVRINLEQEVPSIVYVGHKGHLLTTDDGRTIFIYEPVLGD